MSTTQAKSSTTRRNTTKTSPKKDATKGTARDLQKVILEYREDKITAGKVVSRFRRDAGQVIYSNGETIQQKIDEIQKSADLVKAQLAAAVDRDVQRAITLVKVPRGTTGKGGLHHSDVVTEIFTSLAKRTAIQNNDNALKAAGLM